MTSQPTPAGACFCGHTFAQHEPSILKSCDVCGCAVYDHDDGSAAPASGAGVPHNSTVVSNALADPTYRPYCMRCPGLQRMAIVEPLYWRCPVCPAEHDERQCRPTPPSDAGTSERETGKDAHAIVSAMLAAHNADPRVRVPLPISAAPAAEGPQEAGLANPCKGTPETDEATSPSPLVTAANLAAALPGAEAGTPEAFDLLQHLTDFYNAAAQNGAGEDPDGSGELAQDAIIAHFAALTSEVADLTVAVQDANRVAMERDAEVTRLTSEVRDQTAKARAMWEDREGWKRTAAERGFEVARLTSEVRALREERDAMIANVRIARERREEAEAEVARLTEELNTAAGLVAVLFDEDDCRYDHHGNCQAHHLDPRPCPEERAKAFLAARLASPSPTGAPAEQQKHEG